MVSKLEKLVYLGRGAPLFFTQLYKQSNVTRLVFTLNAMQIESGKQDYHHK